MNSSKPVTTTSLKKMKEKGEKICMITAYDYPSAKLADEAGIDLILVGDSLGMVVLGYDTTIPVTVADMVYHTKAVSRGVKNALVVTDMPFLSYHGTWDETLKNAGRIMQEGLAKAVKLEGGREIAETVSRLVHAGIPVMGHIGLTPQAVHQLGGYKVQGKDLQAALRLIEDAKILAEAGCFALVLECIPEALGERITREIDIPTIGIGAGAGTDGQVLVFHDLLGYGINNHVPKFVKQYAQIGKEIDQAIRNYIDDIRSGSFPKEEHTYKMDENSIAGLYGVGVKS
jgi:3-methyl-2-oxobutanoate hydroxymethyltransferase